MSPVAAPWALRLPQVLGWGLFMALWVAISLKDIKEQRILHRHLLWGAAFVLAAYALVGAHSLLGSAGYFTTYYQAAFYKDFLAHALVSGLVGLGMWRAGVWPAGDTKLFILLALLYPLLSVSGSFHSGWLFLIALINIFVPAALFVVIQALRYMWLTRLQHHRGFLASMRVRQALDYSLEQAAARLRALRAGAAAGLLDIKSAPARLLKGAAGWGVSLALMALISVFLKDSVQSPLARTLLCFALLYGWNRVESEFGRAAPFVLLASALGLLAAVGRSQEFWVEFLRGFGALSLFGVFLFMGAKWVVGAIGGPMVMLLFPVMGVAMAFVPWLLSLSFPELGWARGLLVLAALGAFFGASFALVRAWNDEDHPNIPIDKLLSYMMLHPSFVDRLRQDEEFFDEHFGATYADGLTAEQVEALRGWCRRNGVETVPLSLTTSFAPWIFLGYFITWLLGGHVLRFVL